MFRISFSQLFFIFATLSTAANAQVTTQAQDTLTVFEESNNNSIPKEIADNVKKYKLGKITITQKTNYNENSIYAIDGLVRGQEIMITREEISKAIHELCNMNIFSEIEFYEQSIAGDVINLILCLTKLPSLNNVTLHGLGKNKSQELLKEMH